MILFINILFETLKLSRLKRIYYQFSYYNFVLEFSGSWLIKMFIWYTFTSRSLTLLVLKNICVLLHLSFGPRLLTSIGMRI
jgi:hypothetical protein